MGGDKLLEQIFNLKFTVKQLNKSAVKCEKDHKAEINKCRKAMEAKQFEIASTYAENAIRKRTEQLNYIKLASRLDAVVCRLDTQVLFLHDCNVFCSCSSFASSKRMRNARHSDHGVVQCSSRRASTVQAVPLHALYG